MIWLHQFGQDLRHAIRVLRKNPGFTAVGVFSLALGIGANTSLFTVVSSLLFPRLPVDAPEHLVALFANDRRTGGTEHSYLDWQDLRGATAAFSGVAAYSPVIPLNMAGSTVPQRLWGQLVTRNYFAVLGVKAFRGQALSSASEIEQAEAPEVVINYRLWNGLFDRDPGIIGRTVVLNKCSFFVGGVAPDGFCGTALGVCPDIWVPMSLQPQVMPGGSRLTNRGSRWVDVIARLKAGVSREQAEAIVAVLAAQLQATYPESNKGRGVVSEPVTALNPMIREPVTAISAILTAVVVLLLVIACANVANLLLAQATARQKEISLRLALGATRGRVVRQLLTECLLLALLGTAAALVLSIWATRVLSQVPLPLRFPLDFHFEIDARVFTFAVVTAATTVLLFGLLPSLRASRPDVVRSLKDEGAHVGRSRRLALREVLMVSQIALSVVLLIAAGLLLRSLQNASTIDVGFRSDHLLLMSMDPNLNGYSDAEAKLFFRQIQENVSTVPGVRSASLTDVVPLSLGGSGTRALPEAAPSDDRPVSVDTTLVAPRYFETMGIPLLRGRDFGTEGHDTAQVVIVNEALANRFWPNVDAVGRRIRSGSHSYEVIGVVRGSKLRSVGETARLCMFRPLLQGYRRAEVPLGTTLIVRTTAEPTSMAIAIVAQVHRLDRTLATFNIQTMEDHLTAALSFPRWAAALFGLFGLVGLLLASMGLYGVVAYSVRQRTREIGIRLALGAGSYGIVRTVVARGAFLAWTGVALGLAASFGLTRFLSSLLYGVSTTDIATFVAVPLILTAVTILASYIPARSAAHVEPLTSLRQA